jgi:hypothetical protein
MFMPSYLANTLYALNLNGLAKDLEAVLERSKGLLKRAASGGTKDELGVELPVGGDVPGVLDLLVDQRAVVLQVGAEAFRGEGGPDCDC